MAERARVQRLRRDFLTFWVGQAISNFGSSFTTFALPLLIFTLTGSPLTLAITVVTEVLPYLLFGLVIGAWVDRVNRKRLMILTDLARALVIALLPLLALLGLLSVWWVYVVAFISSTLSIAFVTAQFAAIPSLVNRDDLVTANGRLQASYATVTIMGPIIGGLLLAILPLPALLLFDALSFLLSAGSLARVGTSFNRSPRVQQAPTSLRADLWEGLRAVWGHPVIRMTILLVALDNLLGITVTSQFVLFAKRWLAASDTQVGLLYASGSIGVVACSFTVGYLRKRWPYSKVVLGSMLFKGLATIALVLTHLYWAALFFWALQEGLVTLFSITGLSLVQTIVPDELLGRVRSVIRVLAWSTAPAGALLGGLFLARTGSVELAYGLIGGLIALAPAAFAFTSLGHAERYLPQEGPPPRWSRESQPLERASPHQRTR